MYLKSDSKVRSSLFKKKITFVIGESTGWKIRSLVKTPAYSICKNEEAMVLESMLKGVLNSLCGHFPLDSDPEDAEECNYWRRRSSKISNNNDIQFGGSFGGLDNEFSEDFVVTFDVSYCNLL